MHMWEQALSLNLRKWCRLDARGLQAAAKDSKFIGEDNVAAGRVLQRLRAKEGASGNAATKASGALPESARPEQAMLPLWPAHPCMAVAVEGEMRWEKCHTCTPVIVTVTAERCTVGCTFLCSHWLGRCSVERYSPCNTRR